MIYCVWYPSGGFGNFVNSVLNLYGHGFKRPNKQPKFSKDGNSHLQELMAPTYWMDPDEYQFDFDPTLNYSLLVDNGINNEGKRFKQFFPDATVIKICYSNFTWPVIANTMIVKAKCSTIEQDLLSDLANWDSEEPWVQREKYFLFLRDSPLRFKWKPSNAESALMIDDLLHYQTFKQKLNIGLDEFESYWNSWRTVNDVYIRPVLQAQQFLSGQQDCITDIWTQAVVYYQIWCQHGVEVPHNDFLNFFVDSTHCKKWINSIK
jgi:hypothetical protein